MVALLTPTPPSNTITLAKATPGSERAKPRPALRTRLLGRRRHLGRREAKGSEANELAKTTGRIGRGARGKARRGEGAGARRRGINGRKGECEGQCVSEGSRRICEFACECAPRLIAPGSGARSRDWPRREKSDQ